MTKTDAALLDARSVRKWLQEKLTRIENLPPREATARASVVEQIRVVGIIVADIERQQKKEQQAAARERLVDRLARDLLFQSTKISEGVGVNHGSSRHANADDCWSVFSASTRQHWLHIAEYVVSNVHTNPERFVAGDEAQHNSGELHIALSSALLEADTDTVGTAGVRTPKVWRDDDRRIQTLGETAVRVIDQWRGGRL